MDKQTAVKLASGAAIATGLPAFLKMLKTSKAYISGNQKEYSLDNVSLDEKSFLQGKKIAFLGSSVTYGLAAKGVSFVDYLAKKDGVDVYKSAISGTTLAGNDRRSYIQRYKEEVKPKGPYDLLVVQLSTNDSRYDKKLGEITAKNSGPFDETTTLGALEAILQDAKSNLKVPVLVFTCLRDADDEYQILREKLFELQNKWNFEILDLWNNSELRQKTAEMADVMVDDVHATQKGYLKLWLPLFENKIKDILDEK